MWLLTLGPAADACVLGATCVNATEDGLTSRSGICIPLAEVSQVLQVEPLSHASGVFQNGLPTVVLGHTEVAELANLLALKLTMAHGIALQADSKTAAPQPREAPTGVAVSIM